MKQSKVYVKIRLVSSFHRVFVLHCPFSNSMIRFRYYQKEEVFGYCFYFLLVIYFIVSHSVKLKLFNLLTIFIYLKPKFTVQIYHITQKIQSTGKRQINTVYPIKNFHKSGYAVWNLQCFPSARSVYRCIDRIIFYVKIHKERVSQFILCNHIPTLLPTSVMLCYQCTSFGQDSSDNPSAFFQSLHKYKEVIAPVYIFSLQ